MPYRSHPSLRGLLLAAVLLTGQSAAQDIAAPAKAMLEAAGPADSPGAVALVAQGDRILFRGAAGLASVELQVPLDPAQRFHIGSLTKTVTAATVLRLAAAKRLSLDDPLARYLPDYPNGAHITLAQLLDHTAGISDAFDAAPTESLDTAAVVKRIAAKPADFPPGSAWRYSNAGYLLLGAVIEKVTGKPWQEAMREQVFEPAGMRHTLYGGDTDIVPGQVEGYSADGRGAAVRAPFASMSGPGAAGALSSNVDDLFRFLRALRGGLLPSALNRAMTTAQHTSDGQPVPYGYGIMLGNVRGRPVLEHNGGIDGFAAQFTYFPAQDVTVVVLANTDSGRPNPRALAHRLGALAIGDPYPALPVQPLSAEQAQRLAGRYRIGPDSAHTIGYRDGKLTIRRDDGPERELAAAAGDILYYAGDGTDYLHVLRDSQGRPTALEFHADGMPAARREARLP
jgi:CubicO group peptidase (beta-lactamase class C family)